MKRRKKEVVLVGRQVWDDDNVQRIAPEYISSCNVHHRRKTTGWEQRLYQLV